MQRHPNESFAAYKVRRAAANLAVKGINADTKGGSVTSRASARSKRDNSKHAGAFGRMLSAHFAKLQATPARLEAHRQHLERMAHRKQTRAIQSSGSVLAMLAAA